MIKKITLVAVAVLFMNACSSPIAQLEHTVMGMGCLITKMPDSAQKQSLQEQYNNLKAQVALLKASPLAQSELNSKIDQLYATIPADIRFQIDDACPIRE